MVSVRKAQLTRGSPSECHVLFLTLDESSLLNISYSSGPRRLIKIQTGRARKYITHIGSSDFVRGIEGSGGGGVGGLR